MKKTIKLIEKYKDIITVIISFLVLCVTWGIGNTANKIAEKQNNFVALQTQILEQQTQILEQQTDLQSMALDFEKEKNYSDTAKMYREKVNELYDKFTYSDNILVKVHEKIKNNEKVWDSSNANGYVNLDRYINEFENIGALYCDSKIRLTDLRTILKTNLKYLCNSEQINNHYQNTKSGISGMCKMIYPDSKMAQWDNTYKCPILKQ